MPKRKPKPSLRDQLVAALITRARIELKWEEEDIPYEGNCSAHDPETDRKQEQWIRDQLKSGNEWAWCTAHVIATFKGVVGEDYLGCCSYLSEDDFRTTSMYYEDMVREACGHIADQLIDAKAALDELLKGA
jgi:hypothetical protein